MGGCFLKPGRLPELTMSVMAGFRQRNRQKGVGGLSRRPMADSRQCPRMALRAAGQSTASLLGQGLARVLAGCAAAALLILAGCAGAPVLGSANGVILLSPGRTAIDTNCSGCNASTASGGAAEQFSAQLSAGGAGGVIWSVSGGDANSGPGTISASGLYTPPGYLTANSATVTVTAALASNPSVKASAALTVIPGFLQPLTPENVALGAGGTVRITGYLAEAGGTLGISYAVAGSASGTGSGQGSLSEPNCTRSSRAYTYCSVTYTAPASVAATASTFIVASIGASSSKQAAVVLLNTAGISSNPAAHQRQQSSPALLGSSGGNNRDYDAAGNQIADCCGGTLGSLLQNSNGVQYLLSCNHVLARSDQAVAGEIIAQPGLIDNNCTPYGEGAGIDAVGALTAWLPLNLPTTNADAALARADTGAVDSRGRILELGAQLAGGALAAAPPGTTCTSVSTGASCTPGQGETLSATGLTVAKSGRTTGLTCASVQALNLTVQVDYYKNCAETEAYLTKTYQNQIEIEGRQFSDAGDSGALVVDANNAEPIGLFFAGGVNAIGVSIGVANPAPEVLAELGAQQSTAYTFVGGADHPVSCLNYGAETVTAAQATTLSSTQVDLARQALTQARMLVNPSLGILGVASGKSSDHTGEAAVVVYVDQGHHAAVPQTVNGMRTQVIATTAEALAAGTAPQSNLEPGALTASVFRQAVAVKEQAAQSLMQQNPAYFGVGVGQSLDNPREAALVILVDRKLAPATLPPIINSLRTRYVLMDRLHVTRSYLEGPVRSTGHCLAYPAAPQADIGVMLLRKELRMQP